MNKLNLKNQKFHRLTVIEEASKIKNRTAWKCFCECGNITVVLTENLRSGDTKSCGCLNNEKRQERFKDISNINRKYLPSETSARKVWKNRYSEMNFDDFYELSQQNCFYCGVEPSNIANAPKSDKKASLKTIELADFKYNGLDRLDNSKLHSKENCVPCCKYCNYAKRERTIQDFKNWIINIYKYFIEKNNE